MDSIYLKYKIEKITGYLFVLFFLIILVGLAMFNAEYLSLKEPSNTGRYKWVGSLFYKNENLIFICSLLLNFLFSILFIDLIFKVNRKNLEIYSRNNKLFLNGKYFVDKNNIKTVDLIIRNNNSSVLFTLKDSKIIVEERTSLFEKIKFWLHLLFNKNKLRINLSYLDDQPKTNFEKIKKICFNKKI